MLGSLWICIDMYIMQWVFKSNWSSISNDKETMTKKLKEEIDFKHRYHHNTRQGLLPRSCRGIIYGCNFAPILNPFFESLCTPLIIPQLNLTDTTLVVVLWAWAITLLPRPSCWPLRPRQGRSSLRRGRPTRTLKKRSVHFIHFLLTVLSLSLSLSLSLTHTHKQKYFPILFFSSCSMLLTLECCFNLNTDFCVLNKTP